MAHCETQVIALSAQSTELAPVGLCRAWGTSCVTASSRGRRGTHCQGFLATNIAHGSDCWQLPLLSDVASQPCSQGRRLDGCAKLSGYQKEVSGCFSLETFVFIFFFNYLFSSLEKTGRENFGQKNPSPWPSSGTRRGMWLVISAEEELSESPAPFLN